MSNFGALLDGLITVRGRVSSYLLLLILSINASEAFRAQYRFQDRVIRVTDSFQS